MSYLSGAFLGQPTQWLGTTHIGCFSHHPVGWQKCGFVGLLHSRACSLCGASQTIPAPGELPSRAGQGRHIRHLWGEAVPWGWGKSRWNFWRETDLALAFEGWTGVTWILDGVWFLLGQSTYAVGLADWEMGRAGYLGSLGDMGEISPCIDTPARIRSPSHYDPRPFHFSMFCLSKVTPSRGKRPGHQGPELRTGGYKWEKPKFRRG